MIERLEARRLFSDRLGHRSFLPREQYSGAGPRIGGQQRGLLLARNHGGRSRRMELLFERFLSEERGEWPDIDIDLPSGDQARARHSICLRALRTAWRRHDRQRDHLSRHARRRAKSARCSGSTRTTARPPLAAWSPIWEWKDPTTPRNGSSAKPGFDLRDPRIRKFLELYVAVQDLPRHLGQHSGGMVICQGRLDTVVPLEPATMPGRVVVQWDKEDCADMGILKIDLLGLGMMAVIEDTLKLIRDALRRGSRSGASARRTIRRSIERCRRPTRSACFRWRAGRRWRCCRA